MRSVLLIVAGTCLASCSGGGGGSEDGGDVEPAWSVGFASAGSGVDEGDLAAIAVVLTARDGPLGAPLSVTVRGSGTAGPGVDHDFTGDLALEFPSGAASGATLLVDVLTVADDLVEGADETLVLFLLDPSRGSLGATRVHTLQLVEADVASLAFSAPSTSATEGAARAIEVELALDPGDVLAVDLALTLMDSGNGSALSGVDYLAVTPQLLTFPSGSADGTLRSVVLTSIDDVDTELDELVELVLVGASAGAQITGAVHLATITDNDVAGTGMLLVSGALFGGLAQGIDDDDVFDLGSAQLDSGPNQALELILHNPGGQTIALEPLRLTGHTADFSLDLNDGGASMPLTTHGGFPLTVETEDARLGARMSLDDTLHAALDGAGLALLYDVTLPGGAVVTLELERVPSPLAPDALVLVDGAPVAPAELVADLSMWHGRALGYAGSDAFLSFSSVACQGWLRLGDGLGALHLCTEYTSGVPVVRWLWETQLEAAYVGEVPGACQGERPVPGVALALPSPGPALDEFTLGLTLSDCRLAIETDYQLYAKFGDTGAVTQYVTELVAAVSAAYERDVQTTLSIAYLGIHSDSNDGWSAQDVPGSDAGDLLDEFRAAWGGSLPGGAHLAHFISGAPLGGGIAYVGVLCNQSFGFGVSGSINGNIDWGTFSGAPSVLNWDFVVVAHELGHNFGASHTHSYCPPLDNCYSNCDGMTTCTQGTLMSYCHLCGGMANIRLEFHPFIAEVMRSNVASSCLADATLAPGAEVSVTVSFEPTSVLGARSAVLELRHSAPNAPSPFQVGLLGTSTN